MIRSAKKLFLFCMFATGYHNNAQACAPSYKSCAITPMIQVCHAPNDSGALPGTFQAIPPIHGVEFQSVQPGYQSAPSQGRGYVRTHTASPADKHHGSKSNPVRPTVYRRMQLNGDKAGLIMALQDLEKRRVQGWFPQLRGIPRQIAEVKEILNESKTTFLHSIRTDDLAVAQAKIENLWLAISQGVAEYIPVYDAALAIYVERREQALIQEENEKKQAALAHERNAALAAATAQKEVELAKKQQSEEQKPTILMSLEQKKRALLKQAKRTTHPLERKKLCRQADAIEIRIQALAQDAAVLKVDCDNPAKKTPTARMSLEQEKQALLKQAKRTTHPLKRKELCRQADVIEARIQALAQESAVLNSNPLMGVNSGMILGDLDLPVREQTYNNGYAYQFDAIMTHACQANLESHAEVDEKVAHEILGVNDNRPMIIPADLTFGNKVPMAPLSNYDYLYDSVLTHAYLDNCAIDPEFNNKIVRAICEGLQEAGYAFATKALNPYEALETYKELGASMVSLAKGAFYLTIGRDIYILSGGKYCMSDAELRENIYLVINAIREFDPHAFSAKQVGEFAGTEAAKMVHTFGLGKIIDVVGKVKMARKARSLVKQLDKVTRVAPAERAMAVTAEGFVVEAAHEARAGLALSEINNASQAEKRIAQAAAGVAQEGANGIRPLDYGHSAVQYEQLKKALRIEEFTSIVKVTKHGLERLMERFTPEAVKATLLTPDFVKIQENGVKAFIKQAGNNYNFIALNEKTGAVVTALNNIDKKALSNLAKNYGWTL